MSTKNVCVVIPAAGIGERMGLQEPKQFTEILQKPLICYTVEAFLRITWVKTVMVVANVSSMELMTNKLSYLTLSNPNRIKLAAGGLTRHASIHEGLKSIRSDGIECDIVVIHDGVRPFVDEPTLTNVVKEARIHGAAGVLLPLVSTVIAVDTDNILTQCLDRNKMRASEMPQAFKLSLILEAYEKCSDHDIEFGTECLHLVQKYMNVNAKLVQGTAESWKVTYKKDLYAAKGIIKENQSVEIVNPLEYECFSQTLKNTLEMKFKKVDINKSPEFSGENLVVIHQDSFFVWAMQTIEYSGRKTYPKSLSAIVHIIFDSDAFANLKELDSSKITVCDV